MLTRGVFGDGTAGTLRCAHPSSEDCSKLTSDWCLVLRGFFAGFCEQPSAGDRRGVGKVAES